ncbi:hypothetical protein DPMN_019574 [Dreissena polymorpha]|uniref:Uncharacterized protein n=1 Tax=Dreissena polymorpha TaxID=45954 RepID=A0A9D4S9E7_DREPO|nr:hypothetical protein DPMN_019574 [Dreissena polymorpha]
MKLHGKIDHDLQMTPIDFEVTRSKVKTDDDDDNDDDDVDDENNDDVDNYKNDYIDDDDDNDDDEDKMMLMMLLMMMMMMSINEVEQFSIVAIGKQFDNSSSHICLQ